MPMPGRQFNQGDYRYGHNGQEKDDEIFQGAYTAEYWEYDSRTLRRWNIDPVTYPWQSPYACFNNNPIYFADPSGLEGEGEGDGDKDKAKDAPKGSGKTKDDPIYNKGDITSHDQDLNEVVITPQDNTSVAQPNVNNNQSSTNSGSYQPTAIESVANKLRMFDNFIENSWGDGGYTKRPPVQTDLWGFMSFGEGSSKNVHMESPNSLSWADGNPGTSLVTLGKSPKNFTFDTKAYDVLDQVNSVVSGATDFFNGTGLFDLNNPNKDKPLLTNPNNKTVQSQVIRVHYMVNNANDNMVSSETGQDVFAPGDTLWKETTTQNNSGNRHTKIKTWKPRK